MFIINDMILHNKVSLAENESVLLNMNILMMFGMLINVSCSFVFVSTVSRHICHRVSAIWELFV